MREIKFRFWDTLIEEMLTMKDVEQADMNLFVTLNQSRFIKSMQYSGLKDINGVEIYEGDIVKETVKLIRGKKQESFYVVSYGNGMFQYKQPLAYGHEYLEVIGNIYENPEMIP